MYVRGLPPSYVLETCQIVFLHFLIEILLMFLSRAFIMFPGIKLLN